MAKYIGSSLTKKYMHVSNVKYQEPRASEYRWHKLLEDPEL
jgi:hypothetical protein